MNHSDRMSDGDATRRLRSLVLSLILVAFFILAVSAYIQFSDTASLSRPALYAVYAMIAFVYVISIVYLVFFEEVRNLFVNIYIQCVLDVVLITGLVYVTGGIASIYSVFYPLVVIYAALFIGRRGSLFIASLCAICYGLLLDFEYFGLIKRMASEFYEYDFSSGYVFSRIFTHTGIFYVLAILASFLVEKERQARELLTEKADAFYNLDMLHRSIIESVDTGIMTIDVEGRIKTLNQAAEKLSCYSVAELKGRLLAEIFGPLVPEVTTGEDGDDVRRFEWTLIKKTGESAVLGCSLSPLTDKDGEVIGEIIIFQDLTTIKKMERETEQNRKLAFVGEMAAVLAHELRSPLASIGGSIKILREDLAVSGMHERLLDVISMGKRQLDDLIREFLLFARNDTRKTADLDLTLLVDDVVETTKLTEEWNDAATVETLCVGDSVVSGNETEIRQVVYNLLVNSLQAMPEGGAVRITVGLNVNGQEEPKQGVVLVVEDSGCGIDRRALEHVIDPFYTTKQNGTGLGLAIVKKIVERHGGDFSLESSLGKGTRAIVTFPVDRKDCI